MKNTTAFPYLLVILTGCLGIYIYNLFLEFYIDDAALYASLSRRMYETGDILSLIHNQKDWLDKPHFPFWVCALSFKIFGLNSFAYYLPITLSILFSFVYTFKFSTRYYSKSTALLSVFVLATAQYTFMASTEGRVDPYLMLAIIASIYHFDAGFFQKKIGHLIALSFYVAIAIMTKGIFIIVPIFGGILGHQLHATKSIKKVISWNWVLLFFLILIFILPEIYALYIQFDSQPQKVVFGQKGVSGITWFLWDSQFSRLINSGPITRDRGDIFFFIHTLIWAFFPWAVLLYFSFYKKIRGFFKNENVNENYTFFGGLLIFVLFSISKFQLPHYISIVFPLYAILVADIIHKSFTKFQLKVIYTIQSIFIIGGIALLIFLTIISKSSLYFTLTCIFLFLLVSTFLYRSKLNSIIKLSIVSGSLALFVNSYLSIKVYPEIINYKAGINAAHFLNTNYDSKSVTTIGKVPNLFDFYCKSPTKKYVKLPKDKELNSEFVLYFPKDSTTSAKIRKNYSIVKKFDHYNSENIDLTFLNFNKRKEILTEFILYKRKEETYSNTF